MLGMIVCAVSVYAPVCINAITFVMFAASIASGRRPSKLTINTRVLFGGGVDVAVGVIVAAGGNGVLLGRGVANGVESIVGGGGDAMNPHEERINARRVKCK